MWKKKWSVVFRFMLLSQILANKFCWNNKLIVYILKKSQFPNLQKRQGVSSISPDTLLMKTLAIGSKFLLFCFFFQLIHECKSWVSLLPASWICVRWRKRDACKVRLHYYGWIAPNIVSGSLTETMGMHLRVVVHIVCFVRWGRLYCNFSEVQRLAYTLVLGICQIYTKSNGKA